MLHLQDDSADKFGVANSAPKEKMWGGSYNKAFQWSGTCPFVKGGGCRKICTTTYYLNKLHRFCIGISINFRIIMNMFTKEPWTTLLQMQTLLVPISKLYKLGRTFEPSGCVLRPRIQQFCCLSQQLFKACNCPLARGNLKFSKIVRLEEGS